MISIQLGYPLEPPAVPQQLLQPPLVELQPPQGDDQPPSVVVNSNPSVVAEDGTCVIIHCDLRTKVPTILLYLVIHTFSSSILATKDLHHK